VRPRGHVSQNLTLAAAAIAPKQATCIVALKTIKGHISDVFGTPVMVAELMVALKVQLVLDNIMGLQL